MVMPESHGAINSQVTAAPAVCQTVHPPAAEQLVKHSHYF